MKGLIIKDLYNLQKYAKIIILIFIAYVIAGMANADILEFNGMVIYFFTILTFTSFTYDEKINWDSYVFNIPILKAKIVLSKYILSYGLTLFGCILSLVFSYIQLLIGSSLNLLDVITLIVLTAFISQIMMSILLPIVYKLGVEKARVFMVLLYMTQVYTLSHWKNLKPILPNESILRYLLKISPLILIFIMIVSYMISCSIFANKDI